MKRLPFYRSRTRSVLTFFFFISILSANVFAWGPDGHKITARIAAKYLSSDAKKAIEDGSLLDELPDKFGSCKTEETLEDKLACVSNWADLVREEDAASGDVDFPLTYNWHFVDIPLSQTDYVPATHCQEVKNRGVCGILALDTLGDYVDDNATSFILRSFRPASNVFDRRNALRFVVHLVGDLHQPLHTVEDERGENGFKVNYLGSCKKKKGNKCVLLDITDMHKVWDGVVLRGILRKEGKTEKEFAGILKNEISASEKNSYENGDPVDWLEEGHRVAREDHFDRYLKLKVRKQGSVRFRVINSAFVDATEPLIILQLKKGGIRLAKILNEILD